MKSQPKVSVIVPIYKVEKYLCQCIDSILAQTLKDIEIILVDEGDMDACRYIIDHYEQSDKRVKTIHEKNGGYGASVNKGFDIATGEYISIIESDDFIEPTMYEEMYNYAKKLDADVVKTPYYEYWDKTKDSPEIIQLCSWYAKTKNLPENKLFQIEDYPVLMAIHPSLWAALYKNKYLKTKKIRCIEAKGAGYIDNHFRIQTLCQTNKIAWLNKPFNYYRLSNETASTALYNLGNFIQRWADVHKLFSEKFPQKWDVLASYCIAEEWINTFFRVINGEYFLTEDQCEMMIENLSKTSINQIKNSSQMSQQDIRTLLKFKKNPKLFEKYVTDSETKITQCNKTGYITKYKVKMLGITFIKIKQKNKKLKVLLFGFIPVFYIIR